MKHQKFNPTLVRLSLIAAATLLFLPQAGWSQQAGKAAPPENRYLIIVETSRSMQKRSDATLKTILDMINGGFGKQLERYDTIGVWTYDQELHTGAFPLQTWSREGHKTIVKRLLTFLQQQKYGKSANLTNVVPTMNNVIQGSDFIMVILVNSGEQQLHGTPFDGPVNDYYRLWQADQAKAHMPFVTILRAKKGKIFDYVVSPAPWPVEIPPLPPDMRPATNQLAAKKAPHMLPPLIVSGHKSEPTPAAPVQAPAVQETGVSAAPAAQSNFVGMVLETKPVVSEQAAQTPANTSSAAPVPVAEPAKPAPAVEVTKPVNESVTSQAAPAPAGSPLVTEKKADQAPPTQNSSSEKAAQTEAPASPASTPQATATPPATNLFSHKAVWALTLVVAGAAGLVLVLALRRKKPAQHTSLITRSFEKDR